MDGLLLLRCRNRVCSRQAEAHLFAQAKREGEGGVSRKSREKNMFVYVGIMCTKVDVFTGVIRFHVFLPLCRSEIKLWSPLSSEGGKTHPYKMNLESEPKVCVCFLSHISMGNLILRQPYSSLKAVHSFPIKATTDIFSLTANDEVIVYFPTGGFLGDTSLSARL